MCNKIIQLGNLREKKEGFLNPQTGRVYSINGISPTLNTCGGGNLEPKILIEEADSVMEKIEDKPIRLGNIYGEEFGTGYAGNVWDKNGISPTLQTMQGGGDKMVIEIDHESDSDSENDYYLIKQATKQGYVKCEVDGVADLSYPNSKTRRGRVQDSGKLSPTITTSGGGCKMETNYRIRKLTPRECWRLMGFKDEDFDAAKQAGISNSQLYKQAGNSIVVDVLYYIYRELYVAMPYLFDNLKLSSFFSGIGAFESALDRLYEDINSENFTKPQTE